MNNINKIIKPSRREKTWSKRPVFIPKKEEKDEVLIKDLELYKRQVGELKKCLFDIKKKRRIIESGKHIYIEAIFFPLDISNSYLNYLLKKGIKFKKKIILGNRSQIYFEITDNEKMVKYFNDSLLEFQAFSNRNIEKKDFNNKQISLWVNFQLSTSEVKNQVKKYLKSFNKIHLDVEFIEELPKEEFSKQVINCAKESEIENIEIIGSSIILEDVPNSVRKTSRFSELIASIDKVRYVSLGEFTSFVHAPLGGGLEKTSKIKIDKVKSNVPVIAVVDTGVQSGLLTDNFLLNGLDYYNDADRPLEGNAWDDEIGHGTKVACDIVYGEQLVDFFIKKEVESLVPLFKIFPVKVFGKEAAVNIPYEKMLDYEGEFAKAVKEHKIRIVNFSVTNIESKKFDDFSISKNALLLDRFSRKFGVIFVVSVGNISFETLQKLAIAYPNLDFYKEDYDFLNNNNTDLREINVCPPSDLLSGISVGSCCKFEKEKKYSISSFSRSYKTNQTGCCSKPDVLANGGDYPIDLDSNPPKFNQEAGRICLMHNTFDRLEFGLGTSFSAPKVSRALGVGMLQYPQLSAEALKGIFLHKSTEFPTAIKKQGLNIEIKKKELEVAPQGDYVDFKKEFRGIGSLWGYDEIKYFQDSENEATIYIEDTIKHKGLVTYEVPIAKMIGDGSRKKINKIKIKLSTCILPFSKEGKVETILDANQFYISALLHVNSLSPTYTKVTKDGKEFKNQTISKGKHGILLNSWTADYYSKGFPTFKSIQKTYLKEELEGLLGNDNTVSISVRALNNEDKDMENKFVIIFSVEDLGATGEIRNYIQVDV